MIPDFEKYSLIPVIVQDYLTMKVLMLAYMNKTAFEETIQTNRACYFSRRRQALWRKGETSGNIQNLKKVFYDCDRDTILVHVEQVGGAACHEGYESCFYREIDLDSGESKVVLDRIFDPEKVYDTNS